MNQLAKFQAIADAQEIVTRARSAAAGISDAVWQKMKRVSAYLDNAASAVALELMRDDVAGAGAIPDDDGGRTAAGNVYSTDEN